MLFPVGFSTERRTLPPEDAGEAYVVNQHRFLPVISGLLCPFSVLLEIPGLTDRWYAKIVGPNIFETQPNAIILTVGLGFSMFLGILANAALIYRYLEKRVYTSTMVAIVSLTLHHVINITTLLVFNNSYAYQDGFRRGEAFWITMTSTIVSSICNVTLVVDFFRTKNFANSGSGLTVKQRSLVIAVMGLMCYIALGSLVFSLILELSYINSLYFTICTITTVGFGDITPRTLASKLFSFPYDVCGLILLAFSIGMARETIIETFERSYRYRRSKLAIKYRERKLQNKMRLEEKKANRAKELQEAEELEAANRILNAGSRRPSFHFNHSTKGEELKDQRRLDFDEEMDSGMTSVEAWTNRMARKMRVMKPLERVETTAEDLELAAVDQVNEVGVTDTQHVFEDASYLKLNDDMVKEQEREFQSKIFIAVTLFFIFWFIGATVFYFTEDWTYFEALWFCFIFFTTIGYGDYSPTSSAGRAFFVFWAISGIATMTLVLSVVTEGFSSRYRTSISESKVKRTIQHLNDVFSSSSPPTATKELLTKAGYDHDLDIEPKLLPGKIVEAISGFREHATYFMHGRTGDLPTRLRNLIDATEELDEELENLNRRGEGESTSDASTRHFLFMISYERTFEDLLEASEHVTKVLDAQSKEIEALKLKVQLLEGITSPTIPAITRPKRVFSLSRRLSHSDISKRASLFFPKKEEEKEKEKEQEQGEEKLEV